MLPKRKAQRWGREGGLSFGDNGVVDFIQTFEGELAAGLAVGAGLVGGLGT